MDFPVITLCGSTKFKNEYQEVQKNLTLSGFIVISVGCFTHADPDDRVFQNKDMLDEMHLRKIDMGQSIFVINKGGYIGESTKREIEYAKKNGKSIQYLEKINITR